MAAYMKRLEAERRVERMLPLSAIDIDRMPFSRVLEFVAAFRNGVECRPVKVQKLANGRWKLLDGRHRFMAFKLLGRTHIPVRHAARVDPPRLLHKKVYEARDRALGWTEDRW